jgi:hypothetical protein
MTVIFSFLIAFVDPLILFPSALVGWFIKPKNMALMGSLALGMLSAVLAFKTRTYLGDSNFNILAMVIKIPAGVLITLVVHMLKIKKVSSNQKVDT